MNSLESFSVDTNGQASDGSWLCEVCGEKAVEMVADSQLGEPNWEHRYLTWKVHSKHAFCESHRREPREYDPAGNLLADDWTDLDVWPDLFERLKTWRDREPML